MYNHRPITIQCRALFLKFICIRLFCYIIDILPGWSKKVIPQLCMKAVYPLLGLYEHIVSVKIFSLVLLIVNHMFHVIFSLRNNNNNLHHLVMMFWSWINLSKHLHKQNTVSGEFVWMMVLCCRKAGLLRHRYVHVPLILIQVLL